MSNNSLYRLNRFELEPLIRAQILSERASGKEWYWFRCEDPSIYRFYLANDGAPKLADIYSDIENQYFSRPWIGISILRGRFINPPSFIVEDLLADFRAAAIDAVEYLLKHMMDDLPDIRIVDKLPLFECSNGNVSVNTDYLRALETDQLLKIKRDIGNGQNPMLQLTVNGKRFNPAAYTDSNNLKGQIYAVTGMVGQYYSSSSIQVTPGYKPWSDDGSTRVSGFFEVLDNCESELSSINCKIADAQDRRHARTALRNVLSCQEGVDWTPQRIVHKLVCLGMSISDAILAVKKALPRHE